MQYTSLWHGKMAKKEEEKLTISTKRSPTHWDSSQWSIRSFNCCKNKVLYPLMTSQEVKSCLISESDIIDSPLEIHSFKGIIKF